MEKNLIFHLRIEEYLQDHQILINVKRGFHNMINGQEKLVYFWGQEHIKINLYIIYCIKDHALLNMY